MLEDCARDNRSERNADPREYGVQDNPGILLAENNRQTIRCLPQDHLTLHTCLLSLFPCPSLPERVLLGLVLSSHTIFPITAGISKRNFQTSPKSLQRSLVSFPESEPIAFTKGGGILGRPKQIDFL